MNPIVKCFQAALVVLLGLGLPQWASAIDTNPEKRVSDAIEVLGEFKGSPDQMIPGDLIKKSAAVAIFPTVVEGAFFVGGKFGRGLICSRDAKTGQWSAPAFFTIGGASFGFQFGGKSMDLILIVQNKRGLESLLKGKVTLGGDISAAAGPVGRTASADTDVLLTAAILTYSKSKGLFAGVSLQGAVIAEDGEANKEFYGRSFTSQDILLKKKAGHVKGADRLAAALKNFSRK